ncbi:MAG: hypothetical protein IAG10_14085 [Planctomycetaceae bacterium]|nr:hypothetical protein [Planctomycetaceae bacterium]
MVPTGRNCVEAELTPSAPSRQAMALRSGLLVSDRTAFHRAPAATYIPAPESLFEGAQARDCFVPRALEFRVAEDKPGTVQHHTLQAVAELNDRVALAPASEFALREPMQLTPPSGADIEIVGVPVVTSRPTGEYSNRWSFVWSETLGERPLPTLATNVEIEQPGGITSGTPPEQRPTPEKVKVRFVNNSLAQCFVRINDEMLEIDERQPQYPIYDARQSAWDQRALGDSDQVHLAETVPSFNVGLTSLDALAAPDGFRILAGVNGPLELWEPARRWLRL